MMKQHPHFFLLVFALILPVALLSACQFNMARNDDGSFTIETSISAQDLQTEINAALADPLIQDLSVSLQSGYLLVSGERQRLNDNSKTDTLTFRLDLGVKDGQLMATVSDAKLNSNVVEQNRVDHWNQTITNRLQKFGQRRSNTRLQVVVIAPDAVQMTWLIEKR